MTDDPGVHDFSRLDAHLASVRRTALLNASWRPALAGAVASLAVSAAIWVVLPKFSTREVVADHVILRDVTADHVVPRDVEVDKVIPHDVVIDIPRIAATPAEKRFLESPEFADAPAEYKGRIIPSRSPGVLSFAEGGDYVPTQPGMVADAAPYIGDFGACAPIPGNEKHFHCVALHSGVVVPVRQKPLGRRT